MSSSSRENSSASERSSSSDSSQYDSSESDSGGDITHINSVVNPYENEPLALPGEEVFHNEDEDGIAPATLESRFEGRFPVNQWCKCGHCSVELLANAMEFRCCREVGPALGKLIFDGSINRINCVTNHEDYLAMSHATVLDYVGPLLRDSNGRAYRRRGGQNKNEFLRAVAYRWITRWICGYLGWGNSRPLPACIYSDIRKRFPVQQQAHGYKPSENRE